MEKTQFIWLYEVRYITWGMDKAATKYFYYKENAVKFHNEITRNDDYRADAPERKLVKMDFVCYTRPDAIEDADETVNNKIMKYRG